MVPSLNHHQVATKALKKQSWFKEEEIKILKYLDEAARQGKFDVTIIYGRENPLSDYYIKTLGSYFRYKGYKTELPGPRELFISFADSFTDYESEWKRTYNQI